MAVIRYVYHVSASVDGDIERVESCQLEPWLELASVNVGELIC